MTGACVFEQSAVGLADGLRAGARLVSVRIIDLVPDGTISRVARELVRRHQRVRLSDCHNAFLKRASLATIYIVITANLSDLISPALVVRKCPESLGICLPALDIASVKVSNTSDGIRQSAGTVMVNRTVFFVEACLCHLHEVSIGDVVSNRVSRIQRIWGSIGLPGPSGDVRVVDILEIGCAVVRACTALSPLNIGHGDGVPSWLRCGFSGCRALDISYRHLIPDKLGCFRRHMCERLKLVLRVKRIKRCASGLKLIDTRARLFNASRAQVVLGFVQCEVEHARSGTFHVKHIVLVGLVHSLGSPNFALGTYSTLGFI